ncbi:MAG: glutamine ABC transporter ATP-binding protein [Candidimonas sp.]|nr:MAG: glutamine ABC transporter ATP-binding protein [Candidimonas sp.]TAM21743.1 MAG: glutamine ABC transporter ATP-binding protein [Candidimonas sp.]TAM81318.1 MAG: glutamine ABC transporter ATP-binding protein [Candidimonas sp.]
MSNRVIVSLSSFGAAEVRRHGQRWFAELCHAAGADGVEVRGELLVDATTELPQLGEVLRRTGLESIYSSPDGLWDQEGILDIVALKGAMGAASALNAPVVKMSIGGFRKDSLTSLAELKQQLAQSCVRLLIENDQTASAGTVRALQYFFEAIENAGLILGMTFDMGNWHWVGESSLRAAQLFAPRVQYVHCKGVQRQAHQWVAVPLADSLAPWRTVFEAMPADVPRAIEYPLFGEDLLGVTRVAIDGLRNLAGRLQ